MTRIDPSRSLDPGPPLPKIVERELSYGIQGAFYETFNEMGRGLSEVLYSRALTIALADRGLEVERERPVDVYFRGHLIGTHRLDMLVNGRVIVEIKTGDRVPESAIPQLRNYLAISNLELGLLLHFGPKAVFHRELRGGKHPERPSR